MDDPTSRAMVTAPKPAKVPSNIRVQPISHFSRLPQELRDEIWLLTCTPRLLQIKIHRGSVPSNQLASAALPWISDQQLNTACVIFTATERFTKRLTEVLTENFPHPYYCDDYEDDRRNWTINTAMDERAPRNPVALHVCRESRRLALRHYELAFGGKNFQPLNDARFWTGWQKAGYGEKKIWVDFNRDTILLKEYQPNFITHPSLRDLPMSALAFLTRYAIEEVSKIRRLAVVECWDPTTNRLHLATWATLSSRIVEKLQEFKRLSELQIYHFDSRPLDVAYCDPADLEELKLDLLEKLEKKKEMRPEWTADLPEVKILLAARWGYRYRHGNRYRIRSEIMYGIEPMSRVSGRGTKLLSKLKDLFSA